MKTSLKLSKLLKEGGFEMESDYYYFEFVQSFNGDMEIVIMTREGAKERFATNYVNYKAYHELAPAYDILNDLCVKYAKEMFGDGTEYANRFELCDGDDEGIMPAYQYHSERILDYLQQGKQQEAEDYLWGNCLFNPKNNKLK